MRLKIFVFIFIFFSFVSFSQKITSDVQNSMRSINETELKSHIDFLANDLLTGRKTGSYGNDVAARYIASQFEAIGLKPACDNGKSFFQIVNLTGTKMNYNMSLIATSATGIDKYEYYTDFIGFTGEKSSDISIKEAEVVFVGYGITAPEYGWDDFKDVDVKGKVLLILNNDPSDNPAIFEGQARTYYGRWDYKYIHAAEKGAIGAIIVHTNESAAYGWQVVQNSWSVEKFDLANSKDQKIKFSGWLTEKATKRLLSLRGWDLSKLLISANNKNFKPLPLEIKVTLDMKCTIRNVETRNVIGFLEGSDKKLKNEYIIYTSHYDHLGVGKAINGDSIYNGAFDNATGVSALIGIAKAFSSLKEKPKRSIVFISTASEEEGLLGSKYYVQNPLFPLNKTVVEINMDAVNIWGLAANVALIGCKYSNLFDYVSKIAKSMDMYVIDDPNPSAGSFYRSDQLHFANAGVPCIYFSNGDDFINKPKGWGKEQLEKYVAEDYHQPSDEVKSWWKYDGMIKNTQLYYFTGLTIANDTKKPEWKQGNRFDEIRKKSLKVK